MTHFDFTGLNFWAILVVSVLNMIIGAAWYSYALFGKLWMKGLGLKEEDMKTSPLVYILVFIFGAIIAVLMAMFLQGVDGALTGLAFGVIIALGLVIPTMLTHYLMEGKNASPLHPGEKNMMSLHVNNTQSVLYY